MVCKVVEAENERSTQGSFLPQQVAKFTLIVQTKPRNTISTRAYTLLTIKNEERDDIRIRFREITAVHIF